MTTQKGYRIHQWGGPPVWEEFPSPVAGAGEVQIDVEACGVGLTVLNCINGNLGDDPELLPRVPGHELVGRVVDAGPGAPRDLVGRRVAAYFYLVCGACAACWAGHQSRCARLGGFVGVHRDGGYAPTTVLPAANAIPIPEELDPSAATVVPDAVATSVHVCEARAQLTPADRVVVIGAGGGVGAHMIQVALLHGAAVVGMDVSQPKLALIERLGAVPVDSSRFDAVDAASFWPAGPPTAIIDLIGTAASLDWATANLAAGGRLVVLTTFPDRTGVLEPRQLVFHEASIIASRYASPAEVARAAALVARGRVQPILGQSVAPADVLALHDALRNNSLLGRGALVWT